MYQWLFVNPFLYLARINKSDLVDSFYALLVSITRTAHLMLARTQTGYLGWYALSMAAGLGVIISLGVML